jgi:hypothetical protein
VQLTAVVGWGLQVVIGCHVVAAFRQDDADAAREAEIKAELKAARAARYVVRAGLCARECLHARPCVADRLWTCALTQGEFACFEKGLIASPRLCPSSALGREASP